MVRRAGLIAVGIAMKSTKCRWVHGADTISDGAHPGLSPHFRSSTMTRRTKIKLDENADKVYSGATPHQVT
jgi:hypothetical protein